MSIIKNLKQRAGELWATGEYSSKASLARHLKEEMELDMSSEQVRKYISKHLNTQAHGPGIAQGCEQMGIDMSAVDHGWIKSKTHSFHFKVNNSTVSPEEIRAELVEDLKAYQPKNFPKIDRTPVTDPHLFFVGLTDIHLGAVATDEEDGDTYSSNVAVQRTLEGVRGLIKKASGFDIDQVVLQLSGDLFHAENATRKTTKGTGPFPLSEEWYATYKIAYRLHCEVLEMLLQIAPVTTVYVPGNHDTTTGWYLSQAVEIKYENHPDATFINGPAHRKYVGYKDSVALMLSHGDGGKESDLPLTFMNEARSLVQAGAKFYYCLLGHIHHRQSRDYQNVNVHYMRCVKSSDSWHSKSQYKNAPCGVEAHLYHPEEGRVAIFNHLFWRDPDMVQKQLGPSILK